MLITSSRTYFLFYIDNSFYIEIKLLFQFFNLFLRIWSNKVILESLSMDLFRVAVGYHRGSTKMAQRFKEESLKRIFEVEQEDVKPYMQRILKQLAVLLKKNSTDQVAEDALMYSTLIRNYCLNFYKTN